jgi:uncharacterized protein (DUF433 family)
MSIIAINHIAVDPDFRQGKPHIVGTGITVHDVVAWHIINESPIEWIAASFDLTQAQIYAALSYYYDHQAEIDAAIEEGEQLVREKAVPSDDLLARMRERKRKMDNSNAQES